MTEELKAAAERLCLCVEDHYPMPGSTQTVEQALAARVAAIEATARADPALGAWQQANRERRQRCRRAAEGPDWGETAAALAALLYAQEMPDLRLVAAELQRAVDAAYAAAVPPDRRIGRSHAGPDETRAGYETTVFALPEWLLTARKYTVPADFFGLLSGTAVRTSDLFSWAERETGGHVQTGEPRWQVCRPVVEILSRPQGTPGDPESFRRRPTGAPCVHVWAYAVRPKPEPKEGDK